MSNTPALNLKRLVVGLLIALVASVLLYVGLRETEVVSTVSTTIVPLITFVIIAFVSFLCARGAPKP